MTTNASAKRGFYPVCPPLRDVTRFCHLEMSLSSGSGDGPARSPDAAQRPTGDRLAGARNPRPLLYRASASALGS
jgi:hypothetical protein